MECHQNKRDTIYLGYNPNTFTPDVEPIRKSRVIFLDEEGDTVYQIRNGFMTYPGGKLEFDESYQSSLFREIKEEVGIDLRGIKKEKILRICHTENYMEEYLRHGQVEKAPNLVETQYYMALCSLHGCKIKPPQPTNDELEDDLMNYIENIEKMPYIIEKHQTDNPRWEFMRDEMAAVTLKALVSVDEAKLF